MRFNTSFTTYRRALSSGKREYSSTKTITDGSGFLAPMSENLKATLGVDFSTESYILYTEETDLKITDKLTIGSDTYYIDGLSNLNVGNQGMTRILLNKAKE